MAKLHHEIARAYLNKSTKRFSYDNINAARKKFEAMSRTAKKPHIKYVNDVQINPKTGLKVRIYRQTNAKTSVIVFFHGGGFVLGSINSHDSVVRNLCKYTNYAVVSVEYSLAPEYKYPTQSKQGGEVIDWLINNSQAENLDNTNIFLAGDSAGGAILLELAMASKRGSFSGLILAYPTLDPHLATDSMQKYATGHFLTKQMLEKFWQWYRPTKNYWPPKDAKLVKLPPTLIITAEKDVLKDEGRNLADRLKSLNVSVEYMCYKDMLHGFLQFPGVVSKKKQAFAQIAKFINKNNI